MRTLSALVLSIFLLLPFLWLLHVSVMVDSTASPRRLTLRNYAFYAHPAGDLAARAGNAGSSLPRAVLNSVIIAFLVVTMNLAAGVPAAWALARLRFSGRAALAMLYLATRMLPAVAIVIPIYVVFARAGLLDTLLAPAVAHLTLTLPFTIWILKAYLQTLPGELEDAARMDGCTRLQTVVLVLLPVARPGLIAAALYAFLTSWGEFLLASALTRSLRAQPATFVLGVLATDPTVPRTLVAAGAVLTVVVPVTLALVFQRGLVRGLAAGSVKG